MCNEFSRVPIENLLHAILRKIGVGGVKKQQDCDKHAAGAAAIHDRIVLKIIRLFPYRIYLKLPPIPAITPLPVPKPSALLSPACRAGSRACAIYAC